MTKIGVPASGKSPAAGGDEKVAVGVGIPDWDGPVAYQPPAKGSPGSGARSRSNGSSCKVLAVIIVILLAVGAIVTISVLAAKYKDCKDESSHGDSHESSHENSNDDSHERSLPQVGRDVILAGDDVILPPVRDVVPQGAAKKTKAIPYDDVSKYVEPGIVGETYNPEIWREPEAEVTEEKPEVRAQVPYSFDDIFDSSLRPRGFDGEWKGGSNVFTFRDSTDGDIKSYNAATQTTTTLMAGSVMDNLNSGTYFVSDDMEYVMIVYDRNRVWRHSYTARYKVYVVATQNLYDLPVLAGQEGNELQLVRWSDTGSSLAFALNNNLYYQSNPFAEALQITSDGDAKYIFNGIPDWNYEEDVLGSSVAHYWSPDNSYICYVKFNATEVPLMSMPNYGPKTTMYPEIIEFAYPKAGDVRNGEIGPNSVAELYIVDTNNPTTTSRRIPAPSDLGLADQDHYYTRVAWRDATHVYINWANRVQNNSVSQICDVITMECVTNRIQVIDSGWTEVAPWKPVFIDGGQNYLYVQRQLVANSGMWNSLALISSQDGLAGDVSFLTSGTEETTSVAGYDAAQSLVYYITTNGDPTERHLFRVGTSSADVSLQTPVCLTCDLGPGCRYVSARMSASAQYYILNCRGPDIPTYTLVDVALGTSTTLEDNADVQALLDQRLMPTVEYVQIIIGDGLTAVGEIFKPADFDPASEYRLLQYNYAGPDSQRVTKRFPLGSNTANWLTYMKSTHRVIVVSLDGRGSIARGDNYKFPIYRHLGDVEIKDQITGGKYFGSLDYVNSSKPAAVFGWSYGGFTSALSLVEDDAFQCGISVAPVTSKYFYDTAYTERYLGFATPDDNEGGYNMTDVMARAPLFEGKTYFIAHGTKDDNVHFMHFAHLAEALIQQGVQFRQMMYTDEDHSIAKPGDAQHLYRAMTNFLLGDCWDDTE